MKKINFSLAIAAVLMTGTLLSSCQSSDSKVEAAQKEVKDAQQDLKAAKSDANMQEQRAANAEEWRAFKRETEENIKHNEIRIAETREKMKKSGKTMDAMHAKKIDALEQRNKDLKARMENYEKEQSDWESFKREFSHDMSELGQAIKELTVDNKK